MKANAWQKGKLIVLALVVVVVAAALVVPVVAGAVAQAGDGSTAAQCQSGLRAAALRSRPCVRAGTRAVGDMVRCGRCRARTPCVRAISPAEADHLMDVDALTLPHMAHGEADCTARS